MSVTVFLLRSLAGLGSWFEPTPSLVPRLSQGGICKLPLASFPGAWK